MSRQVFYSRKRRKGMSPLGALPRRKLNDHRVFNKDHATSRSSPTQDEQLELTRKGRKAKERKWFAIFGGRDKIHALFLRAGINLKL